ncbi:MAG: MBL fold metallo-hydrolase [Tissierellia bacterium]|nr:MBL fold metallo-hydrolase [Tissierellia bacterium]
MKIEYIYHSGFSLETENYFLVFDYYRGDIELKDKPTYVFCTHDHPDHFNPEIFNWAKGKSNILYILSSDIENTPPVKATFIDPYEEFIINDLHIKTFGSTDKGVSFLIQVDKKNIFFAGDLNWWHWKDNTDAEKYQEEKDFKAEINKIKGNNIDLAFFPVDPRLEEYYYLGGDYFINEIQPKVFIPIHFGDNYEITKKFINKMKDSSTYIVEITSENQIIDLI